ncbi:hypothetical protein LC048_11005 [Mesobacillus subterraneus]|uniref:thiolase family protein n=1 Tax=Mesobacillus subterraneus TaxID=285983 RepID=UPI00273D6482|nr:hypothetical protein [Mesobacillus subterraneus]WLR57334.1 hypothetical protein LC048_11005 [Mesobacillus subterraneus]
MEAYIYDGVRTPRGSARKGSLKELKPVEMVAQLYKGLESRIPSGFDRVDDVVLGCVTQIRDQGANIAKTALLYGGFHESIPGMTVNRYCTSGLDAVTIAAARVKAGMDQLVLAGGVESSSRVPMLSDEGAWFSDPEVSQKTKFIHMSLSADLTASLAGLNREVLDEYAFQSHKRAYHATQNGYFAKSMIPLYDEQGRLLLQHDELIRADISMDALSNLKPSHEEKHLANKKELLFKELPDLKEIQYLHHPGNSPSLADGASLLAIGSKEIGIKEGLKPRAKIIASTSASCHPLLLTGGKSSR